jgi:hypothetical protein
MYRRIPILISVFVVVLIIAPYIIAGGVSDVVFGGFLLNPIDGNSYLAKMRLGWDGEWKFQLPYTANPGEGAYLFLFYIFLGHVARWFEFTLVFTFHLARLLCSLFLLWSVWKFIGHVIKDKSQNLYKIFFWCVLGSGLGWLIFPFGKVTSDLWVAEAFPFLSMYSNPHFPLGMGILLWVIIATQMDSRVKRKILLFGGVVLAIAMPFGLVIATVIIGGGIIWEWIQEKLLRLSSLFWLLAAGGPILLYQFLVTRTDPVLSNWNTQNLTISPPFWDFVVSFSPAIILAIYGILVNWRQKEKINQFRPVILWLVLGLFLIIFPVSIQRRFMFAYYLPCVILASIGIQSLVGRLRKKWIWSASISILTTILVVIMGFFGIQSRNQLLFIDLAEKRSFDWIEFNTAQGAVFLCSPEIGMFLPAHTGRRVIYGHPFETANAESEYQFVVDFFTLNLEDDRFDDLQEKGVDYILYGPREHTFSTVEILPTCSVVFRVEDLIICDTREP